MKKEQITIIAFDQMENHILFRFYYSNNYTFQEICCHFTRILFFGFSVRIFLVVRFFKCFHCRLNSRTCKYTLSNFRVTGARTFKIPHEVRKLLALLFGKLERHAWQLKSTTEQKTNITCMQSDYGKL